MQWTSVTPTEEGWYWWRKKPGKMPHIVELCLTEEDDPAQRRMIRMDVDEEVPNPGTYGGGEWYGPLEEPPD